MKRILCLFVCIALAVSSLLVSCGGGDGGESGTESAAVSQTPSEGLSEPENIVLTDEDVVFEEESGIVFISSKLEGKTLVYDKCGDISGTFPYPCFEIGEELFGVEWADASAAVYKGRYMIEPGTGTEAYGVLSGTTFVHFPAGEGDTVYTAGNLIVFSDSEGHGSVLYALPDIIKQILCESLGVEFTENFRSVDYDAIYDCAESKCLFVSCPDNNSEKTPTWAVFRKNEAELCVLPIPYEYKYDVYDIEFDPDSQDPDAIIMHYNQNGEEKIHLASLKDAMEGIYERDYAPKYVPGPGPEPDNSKLTMNDIEIIDPITFVSDKYPGVTLIYAGNGSVGDAADPYPFFVKGEEFCTVVRGGEDVTVYYGTYYSKASGSVSAWQAVGYLYNGRLEHVLIDGGVLKAGNLLVRYQDKVSEGSFWSGVIVGLPEYADDTYMTFESREESKYVIYSHERFSSSDPPEWRIADKDGNCYTLPVEDDKRWAIDKITFDTESYATEDVLVYVFEPSPDTAETVSVPHRVNLTSCRLLANKEEYQAYYCMHVTEECEFPEELLNFAPETLNVYKTRYPRSTWESEEFVEASEKEIAGFVHSFDPGYAVSGELLSVWGRVRAHYKAGENARSVMIDSRADNWLRVDDIYSLTEQYEVYLTAGNLLEQDIPFLDEIISYYGFDRSKLKITVEGDTFVLAEYGPGLASYAEARGLRSIEINVSHNMIGWIKVTCRSAEKAGTRTAISFAEAYKRLYECEYLYDPDGEEPINKPVPAVVVGAELVYLSDIEDGDCIYPYYRFDIMLSQDSFSDYVYVRAVED